MQRMLNARSLLKTVAVQGLGTLATVLVAVVVARRLGAEGQGFWAQYRSVLDFVAVIAAYGFPMAFPFLINVRRVPARSLVTFTISYGAVLVPLLAAAIGIVWYTGLLQLASVTPRLEVVLIATTAAALTMYAMMRGVVLATASSGIFNAVTAVAPLALLAGVSVSPLAEMAALMWVSAVGAWSALFVTLLLWRYFGRPMVGGSSIALPLREMMVFGGWNFLVALAAVAVPLVTFQWLRAAGVSTEDIGRFSVAALVYGALLTPGNMVGPLLYNAWTATGGIDHVKRTYATLLRWTVASSAACAVACGVLLPYLLRAVLGEGFDGAVIPAWLLLCSVPLGYWSRLSANALLAAGHARAYAQAGGVRLAVMATVLLLLGTRTIVDAAVAWVVSELASVAFQVRCMRRLLGWRMDEVLGLVRFGG